MARQYSTFVALGDSWTEGVGDVDPARPNAVRGWADRVAEALAVESPGLSYANLAIRGKRTHEIVAEQVPSAVAMRPDLVTLHSGGNDFFQPQVDLDALVGLIENAVRDLRGVGATVVLFTHGNGGSSGVLGRLRPRMAIFNELLREVVDSHGAVLVDNWRFSGTTDPRYWCEDRIHLSPVGHIEAARYVLDSLGVNHDVAAPAGQAAVAPTRSEKLRADLRWARTHLAPWVARAARGHSLGDGVQPRFPELVPVRSFAT